MEDKSKKTALNLKLDYRVIAVALLLVIAGMLAIWQPWVVRGDRVVEVTGQSTIKAVPDEYVFMPTYDFSGGTDKQALLGSLAQKSDEVVAKLKELGVPNEKIKTNSAGYDYPLFRGEGSDLTYTLSLTITVNDSELAQKVQDYLLTTAPSGSVSPQVTFSDAKRKELESAARDEATKDARAKAEQSAKNLGFSVGAVKEVKDGSGFNGIPYPAYTIAEDSSARLGIQPGENELSYSVTVVFYVR